MDKNHTNCHDVYGFATGSGLNTVICQEPFLKASFIFRALRTVKVPVFYLDFDLMYSGYVKSQLEQISDGVQVYRVDVSNYTDTIKKITAEAAREKCLVVLDTLNGFFNVHGSEDAGRMVNAYVTLLAFAAKSTDSSIMAACTASHVGKKWVLSPALGRIMHKCSKIVLRRKGVDMIADIFDRSDTQIGSVTC